MKFVDREVHAPQSFLQPYDHAAPYAVVVKRFPVDDVVPLHYEESMEILLCEGLTGAVNIAGCLYSVAPRSVFAVPPFTVHSHIIHAGDGAQYVVKVSFDQLRKWLDLPALFAARGLTMDGIAYTCPAYDRLFDIAYRVIERDGDLFAGIAGLLEIFNVLAENARPAAAPPHRDDVSPENRALYGIFAWTQAHYLEKISLEAVSARMGYSKYYFCNRFKALTGSTYVAYVNSLRVAHAGRLLLAGRSIAQAGQESGFGDTSYFVQVFKRAYGVTPGQFVSQQRGN